MSGKHGDFALNYVCDLAVFDRSNEVLLGLKLRNSRKGSYQKNLCIIVKIG